MSIYEEAKSHNELKVSNNLETKYEDCVERINSEGCNGQYNKYHIYDDNSVANEYKLENYEKMIFTIKSCFIIPNNFKFRIYHK